MLIKNNPRTNSARLFTPGKMRTQRSAKFINDCGRVTLVHGWTTSLISKIWRTVRSGKGKDAKNICVGKITQHEEKFFQLSFKGMIRFDLNMEHDEVYGKFVLTVCICSILYFCKNFADCQKTDSASLFTRGIIKNIILSCFNFCESSKWKEQIVFMDTCKVK